MAEASIVLLASLVSGILADLFQIEAGQVLGAVREIALNTRANVSRPQNGSDYQGLRTLGRLLVFFGAVPIIGALAAGVNMFSPEERLLKFQGRLQNGTERVIQTSGCKMIFDHQGRAYKAFFKVRSSSGSARPRTRIRRSSRASLATNSSTKRTDGDLPRVLCRRLRLLP